MYFLQEQGGATYQNIYTHCLSNTYFTLGSSGPINWYINSGILSTSHIEEITGFMPKLFTAI